MQYILNLLYLGGLKFLTRVHQIQSSIHFVAERISRRLLILLERESTKLLIS